VPVQIVSGISPNATGAPFFRRHPFPLFGHTGPDFRRRFRMALPAGCRTAESGKAWSCPQLPNAFPVTATRIAIPEWASPVPVAGDIPVGRAFDALAERPFCRWLAPNGSLVVASMFCLTRFYLQNHPVVMAL